MPTDQTVTRSAVTHPCSSRSKHHQPTNCRRTPSPFCAENSRSRLTSSQRWQCPAWIGINMFLLLERWRIDRLRGFRIGLTQSWPDASFAEHSRKPPFSLGLQSLLELVLHKIEVPRVSHRVHETNAVSQKQLDKAIVHRMHAV